MTEMKYELTETEKKLKGIYKEYFDHYLTAEQDYARFCIFMQVGSFYEVYGYDMKNFKLGNIYELQKILNINVTKKSGKKPHTYNNPLMMGFPDYAITKFKNILQKYGYVVFVIDQEDIPGRTEKKRVLRKIISPGTDIEDLVEPDNVYLCSVYLEEIDNKKVIGVSYVDLSTGKSYAEHYVDNRKDKDYSFSQLTRTILRTKPKEMLIYNKNVKMDEATLIRTLEIPGFVMVRYFDSNQNLHKDLFDVRYQKHWFDKVFKAKKGMLDVIEYLDFGYKIETQHSFMLLLYAINKYYYKLLENLSNPELFHNEDKLILDTTTINQLNLINTNNADILDYRLEKYRSVFQVINFTKTNMGFRTLKQRLTNPEADKDIINLRYNLAEELIKDERYKSLESILQSFPDFERLHRKISLERLRPKDFYVLNQGYKKFQKFYSIKYPLLSKYIKEQLEKKDLMNYINYYNTLFQTDNMLFDGFSPINNIFKPELYPNLQKLFDDRSSKLNNFEIIKNKYTEFFRSVVRSWKEKDQFVKIEGNLTKYITMTESKKKILKSNEAKLKNFKFTINNTEYNLGDFKIVKRNSKFQIVHDLLEYKSIETLDSEINTLTKQYFIETMQQLSKKYDKLYNKISVIISEIDFTYSNAKCAVKNNYKKPEIVDGPSFFEIENMRHPMVEKLTNDVYKPFNLSLNSEKIGLVLSALNGAGKSVMLKTIGILVTMAQMGYHVPVTKMRYGLFTKIMTRIIGNDNILTNSSSFQVEIKELRSIESRADESTLVLIDELARGTENNASVGLTVGTIGHFCKVSKSKFILTTHLHKIFDYIKDYEPQLLIKHISIKNDNGKLIYDRELKDGPCPPLYGLMVAELLGIGLGILSEAQKVCNMLTNQEAELIVNKKSKYNSEKIVDSCERCGSTDNVETNHIRPQCQADDNGYFSDGTYKNAKSNLEILCKKCHKKETKEQKKAGKLSKRKTKKSKKIDNH